MPEARTLAVIGAGNMGSGIAQKMATEGFRVLLVDLDVAALERGRANIDTTLAEAVERKIMRPDAAEAISGRIEGTTDWGRLKEAELVVEAVFESLDVKRDVFKRLSENTSPDCILATNTSSFYVRDLLDVVENPGRVLGLHYFYHPAKNRLVEVVPAEGTSDDAFERAWSIQEAIGKTPIACKDAPGFVVNRYFVPWLNEAVRLLEEGVADIPTIEEAAKRGLRIGMGPFELMNVTGVPIAMHAADTLGRELGPFYAPSKRLCEQVESKQLWDLAGDADESKFDAVNERLLGVVFLVAGELVSEGVGTIEDTDIGARVGLRWAKGPFEIMNRHGVKEAAGLAAKLAERWERPLPTVLAERATSGEPFTFELVESTRVGRTTTLSLNRPDAMNAINEDVVAQLSQRFEEASADPETDVIVIAGKGKGFIAGADIRFFVKNIEKDDIGSIRRFTEAGARLLQRFSETDKVVVARVDGLSLGGGCEIALACDYIVATDKATMAFPETGIGIYPGLGGTQRTTRRVGVPLTRWLVLSGATVDARTAHALGLVDAVVPHEGLADAIAEVAARGKPDRDNRPPTTPAAGFEAMWKLFADNDLASLTAMDHGSLEDKHAARAVKTIGFKAPVALRLADTLVREGAEVSVKEGLAMELAHLEEIFGTKDAYEGLSTLGRSRPKFVGA